MNLNNIFLELSKTISKKYFYNIYYFFWIFFLGVPSFLLSMTDRSGYVEIKKIPLTTNDSSYDAVSVDESAKVVNLDNSQVVKTIENDVEEKIYEPMFEFSISRSPQANSSFLWSNQIKSTQNEEYLSLDQRKDVDLNENTYEEFDDVAIPFQVVYLISMLKTV